MQGKVVLGIIAEMRKCPNLEKHTRIIAERLKDLTADVELESFTPASQPAKKDCLYVQTEGGCENHPRAGLPA
jgi:hypothetical protein